jgi:hypothetical protein
MTLFDHVGLCGFQILGLAVCFVISYFFLNPGFSCNVFYYLETFRSSKGSLHVAFIFPLHRFLLLSTVVNFQFVLFYESSFLRVFLYTSFSDSHRCTVFSPVS